MRLYLTLAARYLWGRKLRTFLTTLAIVFGVMIIFGLNGVLPTMTQAMRQNLMAAANQVDLRISTANNGLFDEAAVATVRQTSGVAVAGATLSRPIALPSSQSLAAGDNPAITNLMLNGVDPAVAPALRTFNLVEGRLLEETDGQAMVIGDSLATRTGLGPGDVISLPAAFGSADFTVVGVVTSRPGEGVEETFVPLSAAQELLGLDGQVNAIEVLFSSSEGADALREDILARLGPGFRSGDVAASSQLMASLQLGEIGMNLFGLLTLAMGGFIIFNTFRTVVTERQRDLGMLRAVGASRRMVLAMIITESVLQGVVGVALGLAAGYALIAGMLALIQPVYDRYLHFSIGRPVIGWQSWGLAIGLGLGITLVGGLWPAIQAGRVSPLDALRPPAAAVDGRAGRRRVLVGAGMVVVALLGLISGNVGMAGAGALLFLIGLVILGPVLVLPLARIFGRFLVLLYPKEGYLAQSNLARQPNRAAITASVMMIGLAILLAVGGLFTSLMKGMTQYIERSLAADYLFMPQSLLLSGGNVGASPEMAQAVRDTPGIETVTTYRLSTTQANGSDVQVIGIDPVTFPEVSGLVFSKGDPEQAYRELAEGRAVIANGIFAAQIGVEPGDVLSLETPEGPQAYRVSGIGLDFLNAKVATLYASHENLAQDFHERGDLFLLANRAEGADRAAVEASLKTIAAGYPAFNFVSAVEWRESQIGLLRVMLVFFSVVMAGLAAPSLIALANTIGISVLERTRELGVLRAVGAARRNIGRMVAAESLLLAAIGTLFGIIAGLWLGYLLVQGMSVAGFVLDYIFPLTALVWTAVVGLVFGLLAAVLPARQAARMPIIEALRYE